jgi:glycosyltransferase
MFKITIITICKNNESTIERAIKSVISQQDVNIEYILIDGGSTDRTLEIIDKYKNEKMIVVSESDEGIADAFNKGLKRATGDVVGFLNSDDWYATDETLKIISDEYSGNNTILCGSIELYSTENEFIKKQESYPSKIQDGMYVKHPASFVPIQLIKKVGFFDCKYKIAMDFDYFTRLLMAGAEFKKICKVLTCMQVGGASANWRQALKEDLDIKRRNYGKNVRNIFHYYLAFIINLVRDIKW